MNEVLINGYVKIRPLESDSFIASQRDSYEEIGVVVARDETRCKYIPIGAKVFFDSFMAKKYPVDGTKTFQWFVHVDEIVKFETDQEIPKHDY